MLPVRMPRRRARRPWGSYCTMQFVEGSSTADNSTESTAKPSQVSKHTLGRSMSLSSISFLQALNSLMHTHNRPPSLIGSSLPFNHSLSPASKLSSARDVVVERK